MFLFCLSKVYVARKERLLKQATKPLRNSLSPPPLKIAYPQILELC